MNLNRFPSVDKRPLDLYKLKKAVETRGGFERVCKLKKWAEIGRDLGYSGKIMSSLSTSLKNSYQKWLEPYEEYLRKAKPGVQQQLEAEYGGPLTPSAASPMKRSNEPTPTGNRGFDSPSVHASAVLNATMKVADENVKPTPPPAEAQRPASGFTPINTGGGFTPVNLTQASFQPVNTVSFKSEPADNATPAGSAAQTPEHGFSPTFPNLANGHPLKRALSDDTLRDDSPGTDGPNGDAEGSMRRSSKRQKREGSAAGPPTVAGSHMSLFRPLQPRMAGAAPLPPPLPTCTSLGPDTKPGERCEGCGAAESPSKLVLCEGCDAGYHRSCIADPPVSGGGASASVPPAVAAASVRLPAGPLLDWHCPRCLVGTGEFGFEEGGIYGLKQFQEKADNFKASYFAPRMPFDPALNRKREATEDDVEREFWRLVESITETVEVEYGADIHSTAHGSGFPSMELAPTDPYAVDPWNLNILPLHPESLFRFIKSDISGMTVPWLYVGMCFSTFCWHNEDHFSYSANYQHLGATKTWYGIPGADAKRFEDAMREAVPELFEQQPDLLFQLVTLLPPDQLRKAGVSVYALDQRAGQFVITFPQAYHAGFNHGFNFNEAVNFAPADWEPFGQAGAAHLQEFRRQPCFSHDELLMTATERDSSIKTAKWLAPALQRMLAREMQQREEFWHRHVEVDHFCSLHDLKDRSGRKRIAKEQETQDKPQCQTRLNENDSADLSEEEYQCVYCKAFCYLARVKCHQSGKVLCLLHAGIYPCCDTEPEHSAHLLNEHELIYRFSDADLQTTTQKVTDRARQPEAWQEKLDRLLAGEPRPALKTLRSLVNEGERIPHELSGLSDLKSHVERCTEWVEEAQVYITRKQTNRRKNHSAWRTSIGGHDKDKDREERDKGPRSLEHIEKLLAEADELSFDCPEITTLRERATGISDFRADALNALRADGPDRLDSTALESLADLGKGFSVDIPEVARLEATAARREWEGQGYRLRAAQPPPAKLDEIEVLVEAAEKLPEPDPLDAGALGRMQDLLQYWTDQRDAGRRWDTKARELFAQENVPFHQLEALAGQTAHIPTHAHTRDQIEEVLRHQREAQREVGYMVDLSRDPDYYQRPKYRAVRATLDDLAGIGSKPAATAELEKQVKKHEDWMRKGKRLFGKANAPLHILKSHMVEVRDRNAHCLSLEDKPRMPVEPASRANSPEEGDEALDQGRDLFCICRKPELGMMIECDLCHEW